MADLGAITNSLVAPVAVVVGVYSDGPSVAIATTYPTVGTWFASGTVTVADTAGAANNIIARLWDGNTVIAETVQHVASIQPASLALSGVLAAPAGNLRISVTTDTQPASILDVSLGGTTMVSTITAMRVA